MPSEEFMQKVKVMEHAFRVFHGDKASFDKKPIEKLADRIVREFEIPKEIATLFSKTRLFLRLKNLNRDIQVAEKSMKQKFNCHVIKMI